MREGRARAGRARGGAGSSGTWLGGSRTAQGGEDSTGNYNRASGAQQAIACGSGLGLAECSSRRSELAGDAHMCAHMISLGIDDQTVPPRRGLPPESSAARSRAREPMGGECGSTSIEVPRPPLLLCRRADVSSRVLRGEASGGCLEWRLSGWTWWSEDENGDDGSVAIWEEIIRFSGEVLVGRALPPPTVEPASFAEGTAMWEVSGLPRALLGWRANTSCGSEIRLDGLLGSIGSSSIVMFSSTSSSSGSASSEPSAGSWSATLLRRLSSSSTAKKGESLRSGKLLTCQLAIAPVPRCHLPFSESVGGPLTFS